MTTPLANVPREPYMIAAGGETVYLLRPEASSIKLASIAHALACLNRFTGAARFPYSVAEHSIHVCRIVEASTGGDRECMRAALLHDAHEAYIGDVSSPDKLALRELGGDPSAWDELEDMWSARMRQAFDVSWDARIAAVVKAADLCALMTERHALLPESKAWPDAEEIDRHDDWFTTRARRIAPWHRGWLGYRDMFLQACADLGVYQ